MLDNLTCNTEGMLYTDSQVDVSHYGSYQVIYTATDEAANSQTAVRDVDIVLATTNYHHLYYQATDACTSGIYTYVGLIQDCDCEGRGDRSQYQQLRFCQPLLICLLPALIMRYWNWIHSRQACTSWVMPPCHQVQIPSSGPTPSPPMVMKMCVIASG